MLLFSLSDISIAAWTMAATAVFLMGISKAGLKGMSIFNVTLMALAFGSRASTGLFIPLLLVGDVFAVAIIYGTDELLHQNGRLKFSEASSACHYFLQRTSLA